MKRIIRDNLFGVIIGFIITISITVTAETLYLSKDVIVRSSKTSQTTVEGALNELYDKVKTNYKKGFDDGKTSALGSLYGASTTKDTLDNYSVSASISGGTNRWATSSKSGQYTKDVYLFKNASGSNGLLNVVNMVISIATNSQGSGCSATDSTGTRGSASATYSIVTDTGIELATGSLSSGSKTITLNLFDYSLGSGPTKLTITVNCSASANLAGSTCDYRAASGSVSISDVYATYLNIK